MKGSGVGGYIVEVVARDKQSHQRLIAIAKSSGAFLARSGWIAVLLPSEPCGGLAIAYSGVGIYVKPPTVCFHLDFGRGEAVEGIDYHHSGFGSGSIGSRQDLGGETPAALVHCRHTEGIKHSGFESHLRLGALNVGAVVESRTASACIYHIAGGFGRWF